MKTCGDVVNLQAYIQHACLNYEDKHHPCITLCQQFCAFHVFYQRDGIPIQKYLQIFWVVVENIERYGGEFGNHPAILKYILDRDGLIHGDDYNELEENQKTAYKKKARDQFLATSFLLGGNRSKYSQLVADLQNSYVPGVDQYSKDVEEAYDMMLSYSYVAGNSTQPGSKEVKDLYTTGIYFYQETSCNESTHEVMKTFPGVNGNIFKDILCYACNKTGHYANDRPDQVTQENKNNKNENRVGFSFTQYNLSLSQVKGQLKSTWVLLDTQSSCDIFSNQHLLHDITHVQGSSLKLHSNGNGFIETNMMGSIRGYSKVWYHPQSVANILSFSNIRKQFNVHINTGTNDQFPCITVIKRDE